MGLPAGFRTSFMGPIQLVELSAVTTVDEAGNRCTIPASRTATAYSIVSNQDLLAPEPASDEPEPSFPRSLGQTEKHSLESPTAK
jgi:hypothetical protein